MQRLLFRFTHQYGTRPVRYVMASPGRNYSDDRNQACGKKLRPLGECQGEDLPVFTRYYTGDKIITTYYDSSKIFAKAFDSDGNRDFGKMFETVTLVPEDKRSFKMIAFPPKYSDELYYSWCKWAKKRDRDFGKKHKSSHKEFGYQGDKRSVKTFYDRYYSGDIITIGSDNKHLSDEIPYSISGCKKSGADDLYCSKERNRDSSVGCQGDNEMIDFPKYSDDLYYSWCKWAKKKDRDFVKKLVSSERSHDYGKKLDSDN